MGSRSTSPQTECGFSTVFFLVPRLRSASSPAVVTYWCRTSVLGLPLGEKELVRRATSGATLRVPAAVDGGLCRLTPAPHRGRRESADREAQLVERSVSVGHDAESCFPSCDFAATSSDKCLKKQQRRRRQGQLLPRRNGDARSMERASRSSNATLCQQTKR